MHKNDPLHGVKLEQILTELEAKLGWNKMGELLNIRCFLDKPSLKSSLKFLRKTPWARSKTEVLYLKTFCSNHPASTLLIRKNITRQREESAKKAENSAPFIWPSLKGKKPRN
ncbi:VF530 family DNA-binding protein [Psychromonas sp.]|uniref:VF530 family protein n=1 Tax=Psychromonas sp. TaxID=1884585 RepID=UPI00356478E7